MSRTPPPKYALVNASIVPARWPKVMFRSIHQPLDLVEDGHVRRVGGVAAEKTRPGTTV